MQNQISNDESIILPLVHESVQWRPIKETYAKAQIPDGWGYICLLDGNSGTMLGAFFENLKEPGVFRLKVHTPAGLIDATLLGCKYVSFIADCPHPGFDPEQYQSA